MQLPCMHRGWRCLKVHRSTVAASSNQRPPLDCLSVCIAQRQHCLAGADRPYGRSHLLLWLVVQRWAPSTLHCCLNAWPLPSRCDAAPSPATHRPAPAPSSDQAPVPSRDQLQGWKCVGRAPHPAPSSLSSGKLQNALLQVWGRCTHLGCLPISLQFLHHFGVGLEEVLEHLAVILPHKLLAG